MSGKWVWVDEPKRRGKSRGSRKGIKTTRRPDPFVRKVRTAWKGFVRSAKTALMAIGFVMLLIWVAQWLGGG